MEFFKKHSLVFLLLSFLVVISYANSLNNSFVSDDVTSIVLNAEMKSVSYIANLAPFARRIPYFIIYQIGGINPIGFRLLNIFFHLGSVWLVYALSFFFTQKKHISLIAASLFAVHPILTESVTWISGGIHSQYTFFILLSFFLYVLSKQLSQFSPFLYLLSIISYLSGMSTSEKAVILPLLLIVYELSLGNIRVNWKKLVFYT